MTISAGIPGLSEKVNKWVAYYAIGGTATWLFIQFAYVNQGKPYWLGLGSPDPTNTGSQMIGQIEQFALWPVALVCTLTGNGTVQ